MNKSNQVIIIFVLSLVLGVCGFFGMRYFLTRETGENQGSGGGVSSGTGVGGGNELSGTADTGGGETPGGNMNQTQGSTRIFNRGDDKISLNLEFFEVRSSADIIRLNGNDAVSSAEMHEAIVDYSSGSARFPLLIHLHPYDSEEFTQIRSKNGLNSYSDTAPGNIWSENFYIRSFEVEGYNNIQALFHATVPLTFENVANSFEFYDGEPEFFSADTNPYGVDLWIAQFLNDICYFRIFFKENNGEFLAAKMNATFNNTFEWGNEE